ncbi:MAG: hypothetical protein FGM46_06065 [Ferruginibacter sp.]|nr:hypothetical protein [Ferruginibacter sp.]
MFNFFFRKKRDTSFFPFTTDMHSHIIPGIDDGAPNVEASVELIKGLMSVGVTQSVATPHIISDLYRNNPETIAHALNLLRDELFKQGIDFQVRAAAEYMLDGYFFELLKSNQKLLTINGNAVLTEFSYALMPDRPSQFSFELSLAGYKPVLAHPERYPYYFNDFSMYHQLVEMGFRLQLNLLSLTGYYGKQPMKAAKYILKNNLYSYLGTDIHHPRHLHSLINPVNRAIFKEHLSVHTFENSDIFN